jgi:hypothetical protein
MLGNRLGFVIFNSMSGCGSYDSGLIMGGQKCFAEDPGIVEAEDGDQELRSEFIFHGMYDSSEAL